MNKISAQLYTLRDYITNPKDIADTFKKVRAMGYETAQFSGAPIGNAKELKKMADDAGLRIICTHIPYTDMQDNLKKVVDDHHTLGCTHAGVGSMPPEYRNAEGYVKFAREFDAIAKELKKEGLGATYHNHRFEFEKFDGKLGIDLLLENSDTFSFMLDTFWVTAGGGDPVAWIKKLKGRLDLIHFKDMTIKDDTQIMAEVMEGNLNWPAIIAECDAQDIAYYIVEQDVCQRDPFESMKISFDNLNRYMYQK